MSRRVCAIVEAGTAPGRNPLLPPLRAALARHAIELLRWDPTAGFDPAALDAPDADLYLLKGDHPLCLTAGTVLADQGAPCLNSASATLAVADKARALALVGAAGVPVPPTRAVDGHDALARELAGGPRIVKPLSGAHGAGVARLGPGDAAAASPGPWLVQEPVPGDGHDRKVYGVGDRAAVRRMRFSPGRVDAVRLPVIDPALVELGIAAGAAAGLVCWGADFIEGPQGPVLVDLNAFPGYRTIDDAPSWIAEAVVTALATAGAVA